MPQTHGARDSVPEIRRFALIIGAMKSGTTSLFEYLAAHPGIAPCTVKEPNFFSDEALYSRGMDAYRRLWDWDPSKHQVALEASTNYAKRPGFPAVPSRILKADGEFRFIYIMRDPLSRMVSHLSHTAIDRGRADTVGDEEFRWALDVSRYAMQLDAYLEHWPRDVILPLVHEAMREDPAGTVDRVVAFLGLSQAPLDPDALERAHNTRVDLAAGKVAHRVLGDSALLDWVRRWTPEPVLRSVRGVVGRRNLQQVELTEAQRARAIEALRPEVARLRKEWGVDATRWDTALSDDTGNG
ncbi:MAG: sulfotransferase [Longimicrobiales bacterium]|nr:sulfotransferase [Longimicrobiales bacterium]